MNPESKSSDSSRETSKIQYYKCQVRGSFCEISEEYDIKTTLLSLARWQLISILASRVCINSRPSRRPSVKEYHVISMRYMLIRACIMSCMSCFSFGHYGIKRLVHHEAYRLSWSCL